MIDPDRLSNPPSLRLDWRPVDLVKITGWKRGIVVEGPRRENALRVADELGVTVRMPGAAHDMTGRQILAAPGKDHANVMAAQAPQQIH